MSSHIYQFLDVYTSTFIKIFTCVDSEKTSVVIISVTLGVKVSPETEKTEDVVKDILKHHRSSHRPGIHQSVHLNKSNFYKLFFTLSRLKGPQKILDTIRGFGTILYRQYHYSPYHHVRMPEGYVGGG